MNFQMLERFDGNVDILIEQIKTGGANVVSGPQDQLWNLRAMIALDLDSYRLAFTTLINTNVSLGELIREVVGGAGSELINHDEFKSKKLWLLRIP